MTERVSFTDIEIHVLNECLQGKQTTTAAEKRIFSAVKSRINVADKRMHKRTMKKVDKETIALMRKLMKVKK